MCNGNIDQVVGYVDSKDLLNRVWGNQSLALNVAIQIRTALNRTDRARYADTVGSAEKL